MRNLIFIFSIHFLLFSHLCFAQTDSDKIDEARAAFESNNCKTAISILSTVSDEGKKNLLYILYSAKSFELCDEYDQALANYVMYNDTIPGQNEITERIIFLRDQIKRKEELKLNEGKLKASEDLKQKQLLAMQAQYEKQAKSVKNLSLYFGISAVIYLLLALRK